MHRKRPGAQASVGTSIVTGGVVPKSGRCTHVRFHHDNVLKIEASPWRHKKQDGPAAPRTTLPGILGTYADHQLLLPQQLQFYF